MACSLSGGAVVSERYDTLRFSETEGVWVRAVVVSVVVSFAIEAVPM